MEINLEKEYQEYLKLVGLTEEMMHPVQRTETRRAFFGGCGKVFHLMNEASNSVESENEGVALISQVHDQINNFWQEETKKQGK